MMDNFSLRCFNLKASPIVESFQIDLNWFLPMSVYDILVIAQEAQAARKRKEPVPILTSRKVGFSGEL